MAFENNPNATASITVDEPVVVEPGYEITRPAQQVYSESFETGTGGWIASTNAGGLSRATFNARTGTACLTYMSVTDNTEARAIRTMNGLSIGRSYTLSAWFLNVAPGGVNKASSIRVGVGGKGLGPSAPLTPNAWTNAQLTFTATATSHDLILAVIASGIALQWDDVTLLANTWVETVPPVTTLTPELSLSDGDLTLDSSRYPYVEASVEVPLTTDDLLERIEPGQRVAIDATSTGEFVKTYTPWVEQARNIVPDSQGVTGNSHALYSSSTESVSDGVITLTVGVDNPASLVGMIYPIPVPNSSPFSARFQIRRKPGMTVTRDITIRPTAYLGGSGVSWTTVGNRGTVFTLPAVDDEWVDVDLSDYVQGATGTNVGIQIYMPGSQIGEGYQLRNIIASPTLTAPEYFSTADDDFLRTRWLGAVNASTLVQETRRIDQVSWVPEEGLTADLVLRERKVSHDGKKITMSLASDEALLDTWADIVDDSTPRTHEANLRNLVNYVLAKAIPGAALQPGTANADLTAQWDATNLLKNPDAENSVANWTTGSSATTIALNAGAGQDGAAGFIRATQTGATGAVFLASTTYDLSAREGQMFTASVYAKHSTTGATMSITLRFLDANNATLKNVVSATKAMPTVWGTRWDVTAVAPANTAKVVPYVSIGGSASGRTWDLDKAMLTEGPLLLDWFDGNSTNTTGYTYAWEDAGNASPSTRTATPERLPELFTWEAGTTAWDFLSPLVASAGFRLFCDEQRRWWLIDPTDWTVPGRFSARPDNAVEGSDTMDAYDEDNGVTGVVAIFKWTDPDGTSRIKKDAAGVAGKVKVLEFDRQYPGPGIAAAHLAKTQGLGRVQDVTVATDYSVRPGMEIQIDLPGTYPQLGTLTKVRWELTDGLMSLGSAGLRETPPGAIDLLSGTIDALTGTIDAL